MNDRAPVVESRYRILYRDVDRMGVLYYSRYFDLFEMGRTEWAREQGWRYRDMEDRLGLMLPVTDARCRYRAPIGFDDVAIVKTWIEAWSRATIRYGFELWSEEKQICCAEAQVELACLRRADFRPAALPADFSRILQEKAPAREGRHRS
jgi:acyl-CoA thioester hydrolase